MLTETGAGGLLSSGYLREDPAASYLDPGETPVFAATNKKQGVRVTRGDATEHLRSGSGFRTILVATDRRILVLVGDSDAEDADGDQRLGVSLSEVEEVRVEDGRRGTLVMRRTGETIWRMQVGRRADAVHEYLAAASQAWVHVENTIEDVNRTLVTAAGQCEDDDYVDALETVGAARDRLADARRTARTLGADWPAEAVHDRIDGVERRCLATLADARVGHARQVAAEARSQWRETEYERAHDTYQRAREQYESVLSLDPAVVEDRERVQAESDRLDRTVERLEAAPMRRAVDAHESAKAADDPIDAAESWERALSAYRTVLELDWGAEERRFAGDPDRIRERLSSVVEGLIAARRSAGRDAKRAGEWHVGAEKPDLAREEFETAREQFRTALETARDLYPDAVEHLEADLAAVEELIERVTDGDVDRSVVTVSDPDYDVEASIGETDGEGDDLEDPDDPTATTDGGRPGDLGELVRELDEGAFLDLVIAVVGETGWDATRADGPHDLTATKRTPTGKRMAVHVVHRTGAETVGPAAVEECREIRRSVPGANEVMLATSSRLSEAGLRAARERDVRLLDEECMTAILESQDLVQDLLRPRVSVGE